MSDGLERSIARLLTGGAYAAAGLIAVGVVLMVVGGIDPLTAEPVPFDPGALLAGVATQPAAAFLWAGIVVLIVLPVGRIVLELVGYVRAGDRAFVAMAVGILAIVGVSIVIALAG
jgi:uncharacterized membrane protein